MSVASFLPGQSRSRFWRVTGALVLLVGTLASPALRPVAAASIVVDITADGLNDGDGRCSLREALQAANSDAAVDACPAGSSHDTDIITLPAGHYALEQSGKDEDNNITGDLDITSDLAIVGAGAALTTIDGANDDRVLHVHAEAWLAIDGLTITNGSSATGGGIYNQGTLSITNSLIADNFASAFAPGGGGIYNAGTLSINGSTISSNRAVFLSGGIYNAGTLIITSSTITGNGAPDGGGGIDNGGDLSITSSTISRNSTNGHGGGIVNGGLLSITSSAVISNTAGREGGGIHNRGGVLSITSSTISGNTGVQRGGGIYNMVKSPSITSSTITNNVAGSGGGIYHSSGSTTLHNSILAANRVGSATQGPDCYGSVSSQGYNLVGNASACAGLTDGTRNDQVGSSATPIDPQLGPLADNKGPTWTHAPLPGSPAIDVIPAADCVNSVDQRGGPRPFDSDGDGVPECEIGAVEVVWRWISLPLIQR